MTSGDNSRVPDFSGLLRLDGRAYVVAGAGQGMGRMTSHALASQGAKVLCVDIDPAIAEEIAAEVDGVACVADARVEADAERILTEAQAAFGRVDGLVDIIGMAKWGRIVDTTEADWDWSLDMSLRHAFHLAKFGGRAMAERGGSMVFVASVDGVSSAPFHAGYGAAKAGLLSLVRSAAMEFRPQRIRVNAVVPGSIATPRMLRMRGMTEPEELATGALDAPARPSDIASAILFLTSDLAHYVTGQALAVDGGALAQSPFGYTESPVPAGTTMGQQPGQA